jgi:GT2 family glycosyltransferase
VRPIFSAEVDVARDIELPAHPRTSAGEHYSEARLLVRAAGEPIGFASVALGGEPLSTERVLGAIAQQLGPPEQLGPRGAPSSECLDSCAVSVVVCTRDRTSTLARCLDALERLAHEPIEFVIVDNAPSGDSTRAAVRARAEGDARFRYVREPAPGLSRARNRGLSHSIGEIAAFVDDDVRVDSRWIDGLLRGFRRRSDVACVTGLVASASLQTSAEQYFDARVWWSSSCEPRVFDSRMRPHEGRLHPYTAGAFGTGANFAFRTHALRALGGFDESLGAGSPCGGGEDLDVFVRCLRAGHALCYEPAALVWHEHRADERELRQQMYGYGKGLSAYLSKYACSRRTAPELLARVPRGLRHLRALGERPRRVDVPADFARAMRRAETRGLLAGPFAYARAWWAQDAERRRAVAP